MAFAQLTYRESLRDIEACLRAMGASCFIEPEVPVRLYDCRYSHSVGLGHRATRSSTGSEVSENYTLCANRIAGVRGGLCGTPTIAWGQVAAIIQRC